MHVRSTLRGGHHQPPTAQSIMKTRKGKVSAILTHRVVLRVFPAGVCTAPLGTPIYSLTGRECCLRFIPPTTNAVAVIAAEHIYMKVILTVIVLQCKFRPLKPERIELQVQSMWCSCTWAWSKTRVQNWSAVRTMRRTFGYLTSSTGNHVSNALTATTPMMSHCIAT